MLASTAFDPAWQSHLRERLGERRRDRRVDSASGAGTDGPLLSVVVLNWNGARVIGRCLEHLGAQAYRRLEVLVVDNGSTDESLALLRSPAARGEIELVESATNRGVGGGRNLGARRARGEIVAFLDNDAFPDPSWASEVVRHFAADPRIGAAASLVFFDRQKAILNSAGGTLNRRGHGADWCFNTPYEVAALPESVLYPTGCGMAVRREVLEAIGPADEAIAYYGYDDVEVGIRTWALGRRVVLVPSAWIDHEGGHSAPLQPAQALLRECGRIRNALKYFPARRLPTWLLHEAQALDHLRTAGARALPLRAWTWNLRHLGSALRMRRATPSVDLEPLLHPFWRGFPWLAPDNRVFRPDPERARSQAVLDGTRDSGILHFGWHAPRRESGRTCRRAAALASVLLRAPADGHLALTWRGELSGLEVKLELRRLGEIAPVWETSVRVPAHWETTLVPCDVGANLYELLIRAFPIDASRAAQAAAVAVERIAFE